MENSPYKATVVSLVPFPISENKPGLYPPNYQIEASDTITPKTLVVDGAYHFVYLDQDRGSLRADDLPNKLANSIVHDYISSQLGIEEFARPALFWLPNEISVGEILEEHAKKLNVERLLQKSWFLRISRIADDDWNKYHQHNVISDFQRTAASLIGWRPEEHEWMSGRTVDGSPKCPGCGTPHQSGIAVCPTCRCILDAGAHKKLVFA